VPDTVDPLILDLLEWIGPGSRPYPDVIEAWRTSCPRLPVWEEANERGYLEHRFEPGRGTNVAVSALGRKHLRTARKLSLQFRLDDLSGGPTRALIARHLTGMRASSPPESVNALEVDGLRGPDVTFWSVWVGEEIAGCGALKRLDARRGELKSMRVADAFLGRGVGRAVLEHLIAEARARRMESLWLETGSSPAFVPALRLYESAGFVRCGPFDGYTDDPFSVFMTRAI
jgi:putative acetyltransferase